MKGWATSGTYKRSMPLTQCYRVSFFLWRIERVGLNQVWRRDNSIFSRTSHTKNAKKRFLKRERGRKKNHFFHSLLSAFRKSVSGAKKFHSHAWHWLRHFPSHSNRRLGKKEIPRVCFPTNRKRSVKLSFFFFHWKRWYFHQMEHLFPNGFHWSKPKLNE